MLVQFTNVHERSRQCFNVSLVFVNLCWFFLGSPNCKPCKRPQHLVSSLVFIVSLHFVLQSCLDSLCLYCNLYFSAFCRNLLRYLCSHVVKHLRMSSWVFSKKQPLLIQISSSCLYAAFCGFPL